MLAYHIVYVVPLEQLSLLTSGLYYKLITIVIDAARSDAPKWSVTLVIVIDDTS